MAGDPRSTGQWKNLRLQVLAEDGWVCQLCGGKATEVDHIVAIIERPDLAYVRSNCRSACLKCNRGREIRRRHRPSRRKW